MTSQYIAAAFVAASVVMAPVAASAQHAPEGWEVPRVADGRPDLQGIWASDSATPLQRPEALGDRTALTDEEVMALQAAAVDSLNEGGDAVFGDTVFLKALALSGGKQGQGAGPSAAVLELRPAVDGWPMVRQPYVAHYRSAERAPCRR